MAEELITKWIEEGSAVDLIYLHFSKAFDSVNHRLLLGSIYVVSLGPLWPNFTIIIHNQNQVNVNGNLSFIAEAISGVHQGSVIGPILFVIYVNDLPDRLSADSLLYADGVKLIAPMVFSKTP